MDTRKQEFLELCERFQVEFVDWVTELKGKGLFSNPADSRSRGGPGEACDAGAGRSDGEWLGYRSD